MNKVKVLNNKSLEPEQPIGDFHGQADITSKVVESSPRELKIKQVFRLSQHERGSLESEDVAIPGISRSADIEVIWFLRQRIIDVVRENYQLRKIIEKFIPIFNSGKGGKSP